MKVLSRPGRVQNVVSKANKEHIVSLLARSGHPNRALVLGLSSILALMAGGFGYSLLEFRNVATAATTQSSDSARRDSILVSNYQLVLNAYYLAGQANRNPSERSALRPLFNDECARLKNGREVFYRLLGGIPSPSASLQKCADEYFLRVDSLLSNSVLVFDASTMSSRRLDLSRLSLPLFDAAINDYFKRLRESREALVKEEFETDSARVFRAKDSMRTAATRWLIVTGILLLFAAILALVVVIQQRKAMSLMQQFKIVVDHNTSPIQITDPTGVILYLNPAFEKWTGMTFDELIGTNGYEHISPLKADSTDQSSRQPILEASRKGIVWAGEVKVHLRNGKVVASSLMTIPVFDRQQILREIVSIHHDLTEHESLTQEVEETRAQYQSLVENSLDGIVVVQDDRLIFVNPAAVRIFEYASQEEMTNLDFIATIAPASRSLLLIDYQKQPIGEDLLKNYEMKGLTKNGKLIDLEINARVIVWNKMPALLASIRDITERKALERQKAIWLWEQETLSSIDRQLVGIVDLQKVLDIILQHVILLTRAQFVGVTMVDIQNQQVHWRVAKGNRTPLIGDLIKLTPVLANVLNGGGHVLIEDCRVNGHFSNSEFPSLEKEQLVSVGFFPLTVNGVTRGRLVVGFRQTHVFPEREVRVLTSMAEKVSIAVTGGELYEDLLRREKELELLSGARVHAQEEERRRISREIHDGLGQMLTAIKFNLEILEDSITVQEEEKTRITDIKQLLDNVVKEAREISYNLMPSVLDDFGLAPGLQSLCEQFSKGSELRVTFHAHGLTERLSPEVETGVYRIAQEALNNIAKHAEAKEVEVQIVRHADRLRLTVEDDGKGMNVLSSANRSGYGGGTGLVGMRERATSFNGTLMIDSTPGKGTTIDVDIPLPSH